MSSRTRRRRVSEGGLLAAMTEPADETLVFNDANFQPNNRRRSPAKKSVATALFHYASQDTSSSEEGSTSSEEEDEEEEDELGRTNATNESDSEDDEEVLESEMDDGEDGEQEPRNDESEEEDVESKLPLEEAIDDEEDDFIDDDSEEEGESDYEESSDEDGFSDDSILEDDSDADEILPARRVKQKEKDSTSSKKETPEESTTSEKAPKANDKSQTTRRPRKRKSKGKLSGRKEALVVAEIVLEDEDEENEEVVAEILDDDDEDGLTCSIGVSLEEGGETEPVRSLEDVLATSIQHNLVLDQEGTGGKGIFVDENELEQTEHHSNKKDSIKAEDATFTVSMQQSEVDQDGNSASMDDDELEPMEHLSNKSDSVEAGDVCCLSKVVSTSLAGVPQNQTTTSEDDGMQGFSPPADGESIDCVVTNRDNGLVSDSHDKLSLVNEDLLACSPGIPAKSSLSASPRAVGVEMTSTTVTDKENKETELAVTETTKKNRVTFVEQPSPVREQRSKRKFRREGSVKRGKWKLGAKIGSGAFGVVHVGMNTQTGALMAVKCVKMEPVVMKDTRREIELLKSLEHQNIVKYYGAEMDEDHLFIFQEWVPAGSVTGMLAKFGPFLIAVLRNYLSQILEGLAYLHDNNIMHRDIKGSNILVSDEGIVKLADFGASKRFSQVKSDMMMTMTMRGTPYFMAPEVFEEKYSMKADSWGVGCVAFQMATGKPPWKNLGYSNPVALFQYVKNSVGPPALEISEDAICDEVDGKHKLELFRKLVTRCFERAPENRPTPREMLGDPFFAEDHCWSDDESECRGLFSPASTPGSKDLRMSPMGANLSPIRPALRRSHSLGLPKSPFKSPPLPRGISGPNSPSMIVSPILDASEWPTWAQEKHKATTQTITQATQLDSEVNETVDTMGSLALSVDSVVAKRDSLSYSPSSSERTPLIGLEFVNSHSGYSAENAH